MLSGCCGRARRRQQQWYVLCWSCWLRYASCCATFDCRLAYGLEQCAQSMLQLRYLPSVSDRHLFAVRALPEMSFFQHLMAHSCELLRARRGRWASDSQVFCHPNK